jgi:hypothetical protein
MQRGQWIGRRARRRHKLDPSRRGLSLGLVGDHVDIDLSDYCPRAMRERGFFALINVKKSPGATMSTRYRGIRGVRPSYDLDQGDACRLRNTGRQMRNGLIYVRRKRQQSLEI